MTYGKYLYCFFFKPSITLFYESTEDVEKIKEKAIVLKREEDMKLRRQQQVAQRKLLIKLVLFVVVIAIAIGSVFIYKGINEDKNLHHEVERVMEEEDG